ncbi:MAG: hypothetical protein RLZZ574_2666, partial [Cyanobacteriota bacterium]
SEQNTTRNELEARVIAKAWQDETFKQELLSNPKAIFSEELGQSLPDEVEIRIIEENPTTLYLILPMKPMVADGEELSEEQLQAVAGGFSVGPILVAAESIWSGIKGCLG